MQNLFPIFFKFICKIPHDEDLTGPQTAVRAENIWLQISLYVIKKTRNVYIPWKEIV